MSSWFCPTQKERKRVAGLNQLINRESEREWELDRFYPALMEKERVREKIKTDRQYVVGGQREWERKREEHEIVGWERLRKENVILLMG